MKSMRFSASSDYGYSHDTRPSRDREEDDDEDTYGNGSNYELSSSGKMFSAGSGRLFSVEDEIITNNPILEDILQGDHEDSNSKL